MVRKQITVSAPGTLMLMGEHAVLRRKPALVCAVHDRVTVSAKLRDDDLVRIESEIGYYCKPHYDVRIEPPFQFVLAAVHGFGGSRGLELEISSSFSSTVGMGSSAAVTVAAVTALQCLKDEIFDLTTVFKPSLTIIRHAQNGIGSGADVAASTYGGLIRYHMTEGITPLKIAPPALSLVYCGYKKPTPAVIKLVDAFEAAHPENAASIFAEMEKLTVQAEQALLENDLEQAGRLMNRFHACQQALGVSNADLDTIAGQLSGSPGITGAKISGSGLGDCVIGLGSTDGEAPPYEKIPIKISSEGVRLEED